MNYRGCHEEIWEQERLCCAGPGSTLGDPAKMEKDQSEGLDEVGEADTEAGHGRAWMIYGTRTHCSRGTRQALNKGG